MRHAYRQDLGLCRDEREHCLRQARVAERLDLPELEARMRSAADDAARHVRMLERLLRAL